MNARALEVVDRVRRLFLQPAAEWQAIDQEQHQAVALTKAWLVPLAGLAAVAAWVGLLLWGISAGPITVRPGFGDALGQAVLGFIASIALAWVMAWLIDVLAPMFGGTRDFDRAFAASAFAMTGSLVGGIARILPFFAGLLGLAGGVWSLVLLYKGLPVMMRVARERALGYFAVVLVAAIVCNVVILSLLWRVMPSMPLIPGSASPGAPSVTVQTDAGSVTVTPGRLESLGKALEGAVRDAERAGQREDPQGVAKAATDALAAIAGAAPGGSRAPIAADLLKTWLPERIGDLARERFEVQGGSALGIAGSTASAGYRDGDRRVDVEVLDAGGAAGLLAMIGSLQFGERETESMVERSYAQERRRITEKDWKHEARSELSIILGNGVLVTLKGQGVDLPTLQRLASGLQLERLERSTPSGAASPRPAS